MRTGVLIVAISLISAAQGQEPDIARLKADTQKVVSIIKGDKAKTRTYCQISYLNEQIGEANEQDQKVSE